MKKIKYLILFIAIVFTLSIFVNKQEHVYAADSGEVSITTIDLVEQFRSDVIIWAEGYEEKEKFLTSLEHSYTNDYMTLFYVWNSHKDEFLYKYSWLIECMFDAHNSLDSDVSFVYQFRIFLEGKEFDADAVYIFLQELKGFRDVNKATSYLLVEMYDWNNDVNLGNYYEQVFIEYEKELTKRKYILTDVSLEPISTGVYFETLSYDVLKQEINLVSEYDSIAVFEKVLDFDGSITGYSYSFLTILSEGDIYECTKEVYLIPFDYPDDEYFTIYWQDYDGNLYELTTILATERFRLFPSSNFYYNGQGVLDATAYFYSSNSTSDMSFYGYYGLESDETSAYIDLFVLSDIVISDIVISDIFTTQSYSWMYENEVIYTNSVQENYPVEDYYQIDGLDRKYALINYKVQYNNFNGDLLENQVTVDNLWNFVNLNCFNSQIVKFIPIFDEKVVNYYVLENEEFVLKDEYNMIYSDFVNELDFNIELDEFYYFIQGFYLEETFETPVTYTEYLNILSNSYTYQNKIYVKVKVDPKTIYFNVNVDTGLVLEQLFISHIFYDNTYLVNYVDIIIKLDLQKYNYTSLAIYHNGLYVDDNSTIEFDITKLFEFDIKIVSIAAEKLKNINFYIGDSKTTISDTFTSLVDIKKFTDFYVQDTSCNYLKVKYYLMSNSLGEDEEVSTFRDVYEHYLYGYRDRDFYDVDIDIVYSHEDYYFGPSIIYKKTSAVLLEGTIQQLLSKYIISCVHVESYNFEDVSYLGKGNIPGIYNYKLIICEKEYLIKISVTDTLNSDYIFGSNIYTSTANKLDILKVVADLKTTSFLPNVQLSTAVTGLDEYSKQYFSDSSYNESGNYSYSLVYENAAGIHGNVQLNLIVSLAPQYSSVDDVKSSNCVDIDLSVIYSLLGIAVVVVLGVFVVKLFKK